MRSRVDELAVIPRRSTSSGPGLTSERERQDTKDRLESRRSPSVRSDEVRQPFREDPPRAGRLAAEELADMQVETDRLTTPWQVSDRPLVQAVDRLGPRPASRTRASGSGRLQSDDELLRPN